MAKRRASDTGKKSNSFLRLMKNTIASSKSRVLSSNNNPLKGLSKPIPSIPVTAAPTGGGIGGGGGMSFGSSQGATQNQGRDISSQLRQYMGGGSSKYSMTPQQEAQASIDLEYNPRESALQVALANARANTKQGVATQQGYGEKHGANLKGIYEQLTGALQNNVGATGKMFDSTQKNTQDIFEQLMKRQQSATSGVQDSLRANAEKMGLTEALDDPQKRLANILSELQGFSTAQNQNIQGAIGAQAANEQAHGQRGVAQSQNEGALAQRDLQTQVAKAVANMQLQGQGEEINYGRQLLDLNQSKSTALNKLVNDITSARSASEKQDAQDAFAQYIQEQTLDIQRGRLGLDANKADQSYGIDLARLGMDRQKLQTELNRTDDPLKRMKLQAEIDNLNARTSAVGSGGSGGAGANTNSALERFYNNPQQGYWKGSAGPNIRNAVNSIIKNASNEAITNSQEGGLGPQVDPYTLAQAYIGQYKGLNPTALRTALQLYYGKSK